MANIQLKAKDADREFRMLVDIRTQPRYINHGYLNPATLSDHVTALPDLTDKAIMVRLAQPAVGAFDGATLARIQRSFKRYTCSK